MDKKRKQLGRGLSVLLGDGAQGLADQGPADLDMTKTDQLVAITRLTPCPMQPRRTFNELQLAELSQSIKEKGILQPLVVRPVPHDQPGDQANDRANDRPRYEIICGERRWRAAQRAAVHEVPVVVRVVSDGDALEIALIENLQRENLSALDEAEAYQRLMAEFGHTQEAMAQTIGKSRPHVANMVRLLALPDGIKAQLADGRLSAGHGRALLSAKSSPAAMAAMAKIIIAKGLSVREAEALVRREAASNNAAQAPSDKDTNTSAHKDADTVALERELTDLIGLKAEIRSKGNGGQVVFRYGSLDALDALINRLR